MKHISKSNLTILSAGVMAAGLAIILAPDIMAQGRVGNAGAIGAPDLSVATVVRRIQQTLVFVSSVLAVIFVTIGGIRYASSNGNPAQIEGAKKTITYALVGLILSILAAALVGFVIGRGPQ